MNTSKPVIFITGQSGLLGQYLIHNFTDQYQLIGLNRINNDPNNPQWDYLESLDRLNLEAPFAVIHLAGAGIADKRWSKHCKKTIYDSRINGTDWLVETINSTKARPKVFLCASAIGYYGNRPKEELNETSTSGENYVAEIAKHWEAATEPLATDQIRVINLRFGMILSKEGGALKDMILPFKLGLGGKLGDGKQMYSWIDIEDVKSAIAFLLKNNHIKGPLNLTSPQAVTNYKFTQTLAKTLNRPAFMHMPAFMVRLVFGEMADELLLADTHVVPDRLLAEGFEFKYPELQQSMQHLLT